MGRAFNSIEKVIDLESAQGYQDKAVVGGMGNFAALWVSQAQEEALDEADMALIEQIAETLSGYGQLPGTEARAKAITLLGEKLRMRAERLAKAKPAATRETKAPAPVATKPPPANRAISSAQSSGRTWRPASTTAASIPAFRPSPTDTSTSATPSRSA